MLDISGKDFALCIKGTDEFALLFPSALNRIVISGFGTTVS